MPAHPSIVHCNNSPEYIFSHVDVKNGITEFEPLQNDFYRLDHYSSINRCEKRESASKKKKFKNWFIHEMEER